MVIISKLNLILPIIVTMYEQFLVIKIENDSLKLFSIGKWTLSSIRQIEIQLEKIPHDKKIIWDVSDVSDFDSAGVLLFKKYYEHFKKKTSVDVIAYTSSQKKNV